MSGLCAVPGCPNEAELFHPDRYVGLCREHPDWILAYGIVGSERETDRRVNAKLTADIRLAPVEKQTAKCHTRQV